MAMCGLLRFLICCEELAQGAASHLDPSIDDSAFMATTALCRLHNQYSPCGVHVWGVFEKGVTQARLISAETEKIDMPPL